MLLAAAHDLFSPLSWFQKSNPIPIPQLTLKSLFSIVFSR
jgi:hypothetical protein